MKSKRRHELQTNELADRLGHWIERVRPHLPTIALAAVAAAAIVGAWFYWASSKEKLVTQAWRQYLYAGSSSQGDLLNELNIVAEDFSDTQAGLWAAQGAADIEAGQAVQKMFVARAEAEKGLDTASDGYKSVLESKLVKKSSMLELRAHYGLAQTLEADNQLEAAIEHYQVVADADPDSELAKVSLRRVEHLSKKSTIKWYNWFANQSSMSRPPATSSPFGGGIGSGVDLNSVPDGPPSSGLMGDATDDQGAAEPVKSSESSESDGSKPAEKSAEKGAAEKDAEKDAGTEDAETAAPKTEGPTMEPPVVEPPVVEPPVVEPPVVEPPVVEPPVVEPPKKSPTQAGNEEGGGQ